MGFLLWVDFVLLIATGKDVDKSEEITQTRPDRRKHKKLPKRRKGYKKRSPQAHGWRSRVDQMDRILRGGAVERTATYEVVFPLTLLTDGAFTTLLWPVGSYQVSW
jgi:hypothetical protein